MGVWLGPRGGKPEPILLYKAGDTGTFTAVAFAAFGGVGKEPGAYYQNDYVTAAIQNNIGGGYDTRSGLLVCGPVDLTKYKKIRISYTDATVVSSGTRYRNAKFYVSTSADSYDEARDTFVAASDGSGSLELDVSGLSGMHYVGIALSAAGSSSTVTTLNITAITVTAD
jgi:hypothetical protein